MKCHTTICKLIVIVPECKCLDTCKSIAIELDEQQSSQSI